MTQPKAVTVAVVLVRAPNHRQLAEDLSRYVGAHSCNTLVTMSDCHSFSDFDALSNVMGSSGLDDFEELVPGTAKAARLCEDVCVELSGLPAMR